MDSVPNTAPHLGAVPDPGKRRSFFFHCRVQIPLLTVRVVLTQILAIIVILALSSKLWKIPKSLVPEKDDDDKGSRKRAASDTDTEDKPKFYSELEIAGDGIKVIFCLWTPYALVFGLTGLSYGRQVLDSFVGLW